MIQPVPDSSAKAYLHVEMFLHRYRCCSGNHENTKLEFITVRLQGKIKEFITGKFPYEGCWPYGKL
jgi:hypothetical protein